ncbi:MAG TPA: hypothetical protein VK781_08945, partial [Solirubrobacteraceae bacterium]|nr:hypothetical protein [Solirubrobacteraceae bacterium]
MTRPAYRQKAANQIRRSTNGRGLRALTITLCLACWGALASTAIAAEPSPLEASLVPELNEPAPVLSVSSETVRWTPIGEETYYEVAISNAPRGAAGRSTEYLSLTRQPGEAQTYTVALEPGQSAYVGVSADNTPSWSVQEAIVTRPSAPAPEPPAPEPPAGEPPAPESPTPEPPISEPPAESPAPAHQAPVLSVKGSTVSWSAIPGVSSYT